MLRPVRGFLMYPSTIRDCSASQSSPSMSEPHWAKPSNHSARRTFGLTSQGSRFLNWSSCLASVEERLAPPSRVCACLDSLRPCHLRAKLNEPDSLDGHSE